MKIVKMLGQLTTGACLVLSVGCASVHPGNIAKTVPSEATLPELVLSSQRNSDLSDEFYTFLTITLENKSGDIVRVHQGSISFDIKEANVPNILVGNDLTAWIESAESRLKLKQSNADSLNTGLVLGGLGTSLIGSLTSNSTVSILGASVMGVGATKAAVEQSGQSIDGAQSAKRVPETHFASSFSIPAGGFVRKWIVFQKPKNSNPRGVVMKLVFEDQQVGQYAVALQ